MHNNLTGFPRQPQISVGLLREISKATHALIDLNLTLLDHVGGDADVEDGTNVEDEGLTGLDQCGRPLSGPGCPEADPDGPSSPEWTSLGRFKSQARSQSLPHEDAEQDDEPEHADEDGCTANEDRGSAYSSNDDGRPGDADDAEQEHDDERVQMFGDVPVLPVFALEPNVFTGKRELLGMNNLQPSFRGNGANLKAVD